MAGPQIRLTLPGVSMLARHVLPLGTGSPAKAAIRPAELSQPQNPPPARAHRAPAPKCASFRRAWSKRASFKRASFKRASFKHAPIVWVPPAVRPPAAPYRNIRAASIRAGIVVDFLWAVLSRFVLPLAGPGPGGHRAWLALPHPPGRTARAFLLVCLRSFPSFLSGQGSRA